MAGMKKVDSTILDTDLTAVADAIRQKGGTEEKMEFPQGFVDAIGELKISEGENVDLFWLYSTNQIQEYTSDQDGVLISNAWKYCTSIQRVTYTNLKETGSYMFSSCNYLYEAYFPAVERVGVGTFSGCTYMHTVSLPAAKVFWNNVFERCKYLTCCDFPAATELGSNVFKSCERLETLILRSPTAATLGDTNSFTGTPIESGTGYIYVPAALLETYKAASNWSAYAEQLRAIEDYPEITGGTAV